MKPEIVSNLPCPTCQILDTVSLVIPTQNDKIIWCANGHVNVFTCGASKQVFNFCE